MCNKKNDKNSRDYSDTLKAVYQILYCKQKFPAMVNKLVLMDPQSHWHGELSMTPLDNHRSLGGEQLLAVAR